MDPNHVVSTVQNREQKIPKQPFGRRIRQFFRHYGFAYGLIFPAFIFMLAVHFIPMAEGIWMSFLKLNEFTLPEFLSAPFVGLHNYWSVLFNSQDPIRSGLQYAIRNTAIYTVVVTIGVLVVGMITALLLNRKFPGRGFARTMLLLPWVVPSYVVGILWGFMWQKDSGIINQLLVQVFHILPTKPFWLIGHNTIWAIIVPSIWRSWPFIMIVFLSGLQIIPEELYEAAKIDGARPFRRFWHITLPLMKPIIAIQVLFQLIYNVYQYNIVVMMFGNGSGYPGQWGDILMTALTRQTFGYWAFGPGAAASFLLMLAMMVVVVIWYRAFRAELVSE